MAHSVGCRSLLMRLYQCRTVLYYMPHLRCSVSHTEAQLYAPKSKNTRMLLKEGRSDRRSYKNMEHLADKPRLASLGFLAFSLFGKSDEANPEDEIIMLLKRAKLSMMRDEFEAADGFLHKAIRLAHQSHNNQAIIYTYIMMGNLALVQGQLTNAEKLFKAAMSFMLSGGAPEDDNAVIEMSLKLASIYASQDRHDLAEHGYRFCVESLAAKVEKQKDLPADVLTEEDRKNTRLLLGLCLDSRARYLTIRRQLDQAAVHYRQALQICHEEQGETHPQTVVLMNDLATVLDLQGKHKEALEQVQRAVALAKESDHPEQYVLLGNMAGILLHQGQLADSVQLYREALALAQAVGDGEAVGHIRKGMEELEKQRKGQKDST